MRKTLWILAIGFLFVSMAMADSACGAAKLDTYLVANFTCHIGDLDFSNFYFNNPSTTPPGPVTAPAIDVTPVNDPVNGPSFFFGENMQVASQPPATDGGTTESQDIQVGFTVTGKNGALISDLDIGFNGTYQGTGTTSFIESWCFANESPLFCSGNAANNFSVSNPVAPPFHKEIDFASPHSVVTVFKDVGVNSGSNGTAHISVFDNSFSTVPEPTYTSLLVAGILGLGWLRKRRQSKV